MEKPDFKINIVPYYEKVLFFLFFIISYTSAFAEKTYHESKDGFCYYVVHDFGKGTGILSPSGNVLIPQSLETMVLTYVDYTGMFMTFDGKRGVITKNGEWVIPNGKYYYAVPKKTGNKKWIKVETKDGKYGACDEYGNEIIPPSFADVQYFTKYQSFGTKKTKSQEKFTLYKGNKDGSSRNYADNSNSKSKSSFYNPDRIDNREKIKKQEAHILSLKEKKKKCFYCKGTGKERKNLCMSCHGTGTIKMIVTFQQYQYFPCNYCNQTGYRETQCLECLKTNMSISFAENILTSLKETHGMTKQQEETYYKNKAQQAQMQLEWQQEIDAIAQPYIDAPTSSSNNNTTSICSLCNGTGYDRTAYDPTFVTGVGGYFNYEGNKCPVCGKFNAHHHTYCPVCKADKWP